jgi:flavin-dependent dehydrogenase
MIKTDVLIVGGGPAGAACAWRLKEKHISSIILDQASFPRLKPCAGWITPQVVKDLKLDLAAYPYGLTTFKSFLISVWGFRFRLPTRQYAIRRIEFDDWLLHRDGVTIQVHKVENIVEEGGGYVIDGEFFGKYLVGAGGTHCPVYRSLFKSAAPRAYGSQIVAMEEEFPYSYKDGRCRLWFFDQDLPGYAWYVPKANGIVNIGVGGMALGLKENNDSILKHWLYLVDNLDRLGLVEGRSYQPVSHTYYLRQKQIQRRRGNAFIIGDAAGLATLDMGEGIGPAIRSGLLAAEAIAGNTTYSIESIPKYSLAGIVRSGMLRR